MKERDKYIFPCINHGSDSFKCPKLCSETIVLAACGTFIWIWTLCDLKGCGVWENVDNLLIHLTVSFLHSKAKAGHSLNTQIKDTESAHDRWE